MKHMSIFLFAGTIIITTCFTSAQTHSEDNMLTDPSKVAEALTKQNIWILPQPRTVQILEDVSFNLAACTGIHISGTDMDAILAPVSRLQDLLKERGSISLDVLDAPTPESAITLAVGPYGDITQKDLENLGDEGYVLRIDNKSVLVCANDIAGIRHGTRTLAQIAADRTKLPGLLVRDWPALQWRGFMQDISRGQVPHPESLHRLADVLAEAKINLLELYIEHAFRFPSHPDVAPPEALTPEEGRALFDYAATLGIEVHPLLQVLGHSYHILKLPQYEHLRIGPSEKAPWIMTFDIRNPEAVEMVNALVDDVCTTFPGTFLSVDITEIDIDGLADQGIPVEEVTDLVFDYVLQLNEMVKQHNMRLLIAQGPLDSVGHLAGMGPRLDDLPRDIIIGSYYTAGGPYAPAWEKDFPRLQEKGFDFFAQAWITAHVRLLPWVGDAADFSDAEVRHGLQHGAMGSLTTDWGDCGHVHFVGQEWYPALYHGASAWTGAQQDRDYFDATFTRLFYGLDDDSVARATQLAGNINGQLIPVRLEDGTVVQQASMHFWEFFHDPFTHPDITKIADPGAMGQNILEPASKAVQLLEKAHERATRNKDNIEQLLFGARCYEAMGHKLIVLGHYQDPDYPREEVAQEMEEVADVYVELQADFERLWLDENRDNDDFRTRVNWFGFTVNAYREKARELRENT